MDGTSMTATAPTEVVMANPVENPVAPAEVSSNPADFSKEMAKIAAEQGLKIDATGNAVPVNAPAPVVEAVAQPVPLQAATQPTTVPEKFQTKDGQADMSKVEKSTANAEEMIKKYREKEIELKRVINGVNTLQAQVPAPVQPQATAIPQGNITAAQINEALKRTNDPGQVLLELSQLTYQSAYNQALTDAKAEMSHINDRLESQQRAKELERISQVDPWVFSPEGLSRLTEIRQANPYLNHSPEPWQAAYDKHLADQVKSQRGGLQVNIPNPQASTVRAPATPVNAVNPPVNVARLSNSPSELNTYLNTLTKEQEIAFFRANGLTGAR